MEESPGEFLEEIPGGIAFRIPWKKIPGEIRCENLSRSFWEKFRKNTPKEFLEEIPSANLQRSFRREFSDDFLYEISGEIDIQNFLRNS